MGKIEERMSKLHGERVERPGDPHHLQYVVAANKAFDHLLDKLAELEDHVSDQSGLDTWELSKLDPDVRASDPVLRQYEAIVGEIRKTSRGWRQRLLTLLNKVD